MDTMAQSTAWHLVSHGIPWYTPPQYTCRYTVHVYPVACYPVGLSCFFITSHPGTRSLFAQFPTNYSYHSSGPRDPSQSHPNPQSSPFLHTEHPAVFSPVESEYVHAFSPLPLDSHSHPFPPSSLVYQAVCFYLLSIPPTQQGFHSTKEARVPANLPQQACSLVFVSACYPKNDC